MREFRNQLNNNIKCVVSYLLLTSSVVSAQLPSCLEFPESQKQDAQVLSATCGEGAERRVRLPYPLAEAVQNRWSDIKNSGDPNAAQDMQKVRQIDLSVKGTIELPVTRKWSYTINKSGAVAERCGMENYTDTCTRPVYKDFPATCYKTIQEPYQGSCTKYKDEPYQATCTREERKPYQDTCYRDGTETYNDTCTKTVNEDYSATCSRTVSEDYPSTCSKQETEEYSDTCYRSESEDYTSTCTKEERQEYSGTCSRYEDESYQGTCSRTETETYDGTCSRDRYETETERVCASYSSGSSGAGESEGEVEDSFRGRSSGSRTCTRYETRSKQVYKGQESYTCSKTRRVEKEYSCTKSRRVEKEYSCSKYRTAEVQYSCTKSRSVQKSYSCTKSRQVEKSYSCTKTRQVEKSYSCTKSHEVEKSYTCQKSRPTRTPYSCTQYKTVDVPYSCTQYRSVPYEYSCTLSRPVQKPYACTESRNTGNENYACTKTRAKTCTWKEIQEASGTCLASVPYTLTYGHDPEWRPGYKDKTSSFRDYHDLLPNKFDLLPGESEELFVYGNTGTSDRLNPALVITSKWNDYQAKFKNKGNLSCKDLSQTQLEYTVETQGRKRVSAPNPLTLPVDETGANVEPLTFDSLSNGRGEKLLGRPINLSLKDISRATLLAAASVSRTFDRPVNAAPASAQPVYKSNFFSPPTLESNQLSTASPQFWLDNRFRLQLFYKSPKNKWVRISQPLKFNSDQADVLADSVVISLTGEQGLKDLYKASGPFEKFFGKLYGVIGFAPTPGREYVIKVQSVVRGLPFYLSGCKKGVDLCETEEPQESSYSEPLLVHFTADKRVDQRSLLQKIRDFQERHTWFTF